MDYGQLFVYCFVEPDSNLFKGVQVPPTQMAKASKSTAQVKKKRWVSIIAPKVFNEVELGHTYVNEAQEAIGRIVKVSVMQLTGEPQKQYVSLGFEIMAASGERLMTSIRYYKILPNALRRLVRRRKEKFDESVIATTKDGKRVIIKPFVVTRYKCTGSILAALRNAVRKSAVEIAATLDHEQFFLDTINGKVQKGMYDGLDKIYPIGACEIRWAELIDGAVVKDGSEATTTATEAPPAEPPAVEAVSEAESVEDAAEEAEDEESEEEELSAAEAPAQ